MIITSNLMNLTSSLLEYTDYSVFTNPLHTNTTGYRVKTQMLAKKIKQIVGLMLDES